MIEIGFFFVYSCYWSQILIRNWFLIVNYYFRADEAKACIKSSNLWTLINKLYPKTINMRVYL